MMVAVPEKADVDTRYPTPMVEPLKAIVLEKINDASGPAALGTIYQWSYKSLTRDEALRHASRWLLVEYPGENRLNWREVGHGGQ